jgi:hypothetical protein
MVSEIFSSYLCFDRHIDLWIEIGTLIDPSCSGDGNLYLTTVSDYDDDDVDSFDLQANSTYYFDVHIYHHCVLTYLALILSSAVVDDSAPAFEHWHHFHLACND